MCVTPILKAGSDGSFQFDQYEPQMVLVFQLQDLEGLEILYHQLDAEGGHCFLSDEEHKSIPWVTLHLEKSCVFGSFFLAPAVQNLAALKKFSTMLTASIHF
jgi:hypothetical protein